MDSQNLPEPAINPITTVETSGPLPTTENSKTTVYHLPLPLIAAIIAIVIGVSAIFLVKNLWSQKTPPAQIIPTPTPTLTPTPIRVLSNIATQSAYISLERQINSLSNSLQTVVIQDPSLTPPTLDLSLGFSN